MIMDCSTFEHFSLPRVFHQKIPTIDSSTHLHTTGIAYFSNPMLKGEMSCNDFQGRKRVGFAILDSEHDSESPRLVLVTGCAIRASNSARTPASPPRIGGSRSLIDCQR
jgi:hypothetical protein